MRYFTSVTNFFRGYRSAISNIHFLSKHFFVIISFAKSVPLSRGGGQILTVGAACHSFRLGLLHQQQGVGLGEHVVDDDQVSGFAILAVIVLHVYSHLGITCSVLEYPSGPGRAVAFDPKKSSFIQKILHFYLFWLVNSKFLPKFAV